MLATTDPDASPNAGESLRANPLNHRGSHRSHARRVSGHDVTT